jgi:diacylglycerol kinase (ATP)
MTKQALLLINRQARLGHNKFAQVVEILHKLDFELLTVPVKSSSQLSSMVRQHAKNIDLVIVGGGDGTLNAVVDSLVEMQLPLGILPLGTANDLARTLSIPSSIVEACEIIAAGNIKYIDLGCVNGKYFFNVSSLGLSVKITQNLSHGLKRRWGILAYALSAIKVIGQTRPFSAEIRLGGESIKVKTIQIAIGNGRYYGGGIPIAEDAAIDDQLLDLYSLELKQWWQIFPLLWTLRTGRHHVLECVRTLQGKEIEVYTRKPLAINTDGEITVSTPASFRVIPHALAVFCPQ